jgi:hypothetical protein
MGLQKYLVTGLQLIIVKQMEYIQVIEFFNHESSKRGETFVTRKISRTVARISAGID